MLYRLVRPLLFLLPAETAHHFAFLFLRLLQWLSPLRASIAALARLSDPALQTKAFGLVFPTPVGLAAGLDKDAVAFDALGALGFGFVEVGTLTPRAQPGNPQPRLFRLAADAALINRMGFNNGGAEAAAVRLAHPHHGVLGVNIGKNKTTPEGDAITDYVECTKRLAAHADYLVVNVSSPNTPGLRDLQATSTLRPLLSAVRDELKRSVAGRHVPLLVKIAPDLADEDIDAVGDLCLEIGVDGIIATNTTVSRAGLRTPADRVAAMGNGGLSGAPLKARSLAVLSRLRARVGSRLILVSSGGITSAEDAWERIRAGATLVQLYTGFVYGGPFFARRVALGLARLARAAGYESVQQAVGTESK
jgi:dihydroorotate dehydrogenase